MRRIDHLPDMVLVRTGLPEDHTGIRDSIRPITKRPKASHIWERAPHDYYIEPQWCSQRLFEEEKFSGTIVDPCCGIGRILGSAQGAGYKWIGMDLITRLPHVHASDFMGDQHGRQWDNIVSNPPFTLCDKLVPLALARTRRKCALLMPTLWMQADKRSRWLEATPLYKVLLLTPRPSMPPGSVIEAGEKPKGGRQDFAWFIWLTGYKGPPQIGWLRRDP